MDMNVQPIQDPVKREFGIGKALALPSSEGTPHSGESHIRRSHTSDEIFNESSHKKKRSFSQKIKVLFKRKKTTDEMSVASVQSPSLVPGRPFQKQTSLIEPSFLSDIGSSPPVAKRHVDLDELPHNVMRMIDRQTFPMNDQVNLTLLNENESTVKSIILQKSEKLGLFLSYGLPPAIVTYVEPGGQAGSQGVAMGDQVVKVNKIDCAMKSSSEIRDIIHLGRSLKHSPTNRRARLPTFDMSINEKTTAAASPASVDTPSIDEATWSKIKEIEGLLEDDSSKINHKRFTVDVEKNVLMDIVEEAGSVNSERKRQTMFVSSTPKFKESESPPSPVRRYSDGELPSDISSSPKPADALSDVELPRASVSLPKSPTSFSDSSIEGNFASGPILSASDLQMPRASLVTIASENITGTATGNEQTFASADSKLPDESRPGSYGLHTDVHSSQEVDTMQSLVSPAKTALKSPVEGVPSSTPSISSKASTPTSDSKQKSKQKKTKNSKEANRSTAERTSSKEVATPPKKGKKPKVGNQQKKTSFGVSRKKTGFDDQNMKEKSNEEKDIDDIAKCFEEALAVSPVMSETVITITDVEPDESPKPGSQTPQWMREAAARKKARVEEEESLAYKLKEQHGNLRSTSFGSSQVPAKGSHHHDSGTSLDEEHYLVKTTRSRSIDVVDVKDVDLAMLRGTFENASPDLKTKQRRKSEQSEVSIEGNFKQKKTGLIMGKERSTSRPSIFNYGSSLEDIHYPAGRRLSDTATLQPTYYQRSLSDDLTNTVNSPDEETLSPRSKLLGVAEGRSRLSVARPRNIQRKPPMAKGSLFLHTGEPEKFGEVLVDPSQPLSSNQRRDRAPLPVYTGDETTTVKKLPQVKEKPKRARIVNEEVALGKKMEKNLRNDVEKFQNTVIKAPISSGNGFTVNRRQSLKSAASIVAEAAARKKDESQDKTTQEDYELRNLQRNKRFTASFVINQSRMDKGQSSVAQEKPVQTKPFVKKQASSFVDTQSTQTFQIPLNKVPQTTKFTVKEEPSWISVARSKSKRVQERPKSPRGRELHPTASSPHSKSSEAVVEESLPRKGTVQDRLKFFSN